MVVSNMSNTEERVYIPPREVELSEEEAPEVFSLVEEGIEYVTSFNNEAFIKFTEGLFVDTLSIESVDISPEYRKILREKMMENWGNIFGHILAGDISGLIWAHPSLAVHETILETTLPLPVKTKKLKKQGDDYEVTIKIDSLSEEYTFDVHLPEIQGIKGELFVEGFEVKLPEKTPQVKFSIRRPKQKENSKVPNKSLESRQDILEFVADEFDPQELIRMYLFEAEYKNTIYLSVPENYSDYLQQISNIYSAEVVSGQDGFWITRNPEHATEIRAAKPCSPPKSPHMVGRLLGFPMEAVKYYTKNPEVAEFRFKQRTAELFSRGELDRVDVLYVLSASFSPAPTKESILETSRMVQNYEHTVREIDEKYGFSAGESAFETLRERAIETMRAPMT